MIKAYELRIGNEFEYYIEDKYEGNEWVRNVIDVDDIGFCIRQNDLFNKRYRPITLSPDILERCGFEKHTEDSYILSVQTCGIIVIEDDGSLFIGGKNDDYGFCTNIVCKYLHQLQNLIFALTQTEITIKK